ncbi:DgyrCDS10258 [Dimorphilus gyrociliatus]|uniref:DgyrCDS10258 n=1 Tax=Dimorphilus gyrociliatus TaxID=2664684 RepID=A0A7I8VZV7_9ANNE|nr:DgyrCDS10258 [Dimorphilus gyrociliatus]
MYVGVYLIFVISILQCNGKELFTNDKPLHPLLKDNIYIGAHQFIRNLENSLQDIENHKSLKNALSFLKADDYQKQAENTLKSIKNKNLNNTCLLDLKNIGLSASKRQKWAIEVFDSWAKLPPGILQGHIIVKGSFPQCKGVNVPRTNLTNFDVNYFTIGFAKKSKSSLPFLAPVIGICLPDTCTNIEVFNYVNFLLPFNSSYHVGSVTKAEIPPLDNGAKATIAIFAILGFLVLIATIYDFFGAYFQSKKTEDTEHLIAEDTTSINDFPEINNTNSNFRVYFSQNKLGIVQDSILSFSLIKNLRSLLVSDAQSDVACLHGIRFISLSWVVLGHTFLFVLSAIGNPIFLLTLFKRWSFQPIANATPSVDTFFMMSGTLVAYLTLKELKKGGVNWFYYYFHRFWRLTPMYMLLLAAMTTLSRYWATGPLYPNNVGLAPKCYSMWWQNLLYLNNIAFGKWESSAMQCFGWAWYLANDMQFYILSPIFIYPLYRKPKLGIAINIFVLTSSIIVSAVISGHFKFPMSMISMGGSTEYMRQLYIPPWTRIGAYIVGILTGYILYKYDLKVKINRFVALLGWCTATAVALAIFYGPIEENRGFKQPLIASILYNSLNRPAWALCVSWVLVCCVSGYGGIVNSILSWKGWTVPSRLTYAAYLSHPIIMTTYAVALKSNLIVDDSALVAFFLAFMTATLLFSVIISATLESPFRQVEKVFLKHIKMYKEHRKMFNE